MAENSPELKSPEYPKKISRRALLGAAAFATAAAAAIIAKRGFSDKEPQADLQTPRELPPSPNIKIPTAIMSPTAEATPVPEKVPGRNLVANPKFQVVFHWDSPGGPSPDFPWSWIRPLDSQKTLSHFLKEGGISNSRCVAVDLDVRQDQILSGSWEGAPIKFNRKKTYLLSSWARRPDRLDLQRNNIDGIRPMISLIFLDKERKPNGHSQDFKLSIKSQADTWEQLNPIAIGPEGDYQWPTNSSSLKIVLSATVDNFDNIKELANSQAIKGRVLFDNIYFGPFKK